MIISSENCCMVFLYLFKKVKYDKNGQNQLLLSNISNELYIAYLFSCLQNCNT